MKAKEYYLKLLKDCGENPDKNCSLILFDVCKEFFLEVKQIAKMRNARFDTALVAIFREQNIKWKAFCDLMFSNGLIIEDRKQIIYDMFRNMILNMDSFKNSSDIIKALE